MTKQNDVAHLAEHDTYNVDVVGSIPIIICSGIANTIGKTWKQVPVQIWIQSLKRKAQSLKFFNVTAQSSSFKVNWKPSILLAPTEKLVSRCHWRLFRQEATVKGFILCQR